MLRTTILKLAVTFIALAGIASAQGPAPTQGASRIHEATVIRDEAIVRSGPGDRDFYPTMKLPRGTTVRVIRDEGGGWLMIEPPEGSYSFVRSEFVQMQGTRKGVLTEDTMDRIGSDLHSGELFIRHQILKGETVQILGEETLKTEKGAVPMLRIQPPKGEYRYVAASDVELSPADRLPSAETSPAAEPFPALTDRPATISLDSSETTAGNLPSEASPAMTEPGAEAAPANDPWSLPSKTASTEPLPEANSEPALGVEPTVDSDPFAHSQPTKSAAQAATSPPAKKTAAAHKATGSQLPGSAEEGIAPPTAGFDAPTRLSPTSAGHSTTSQPQVPQSAQEQLAAIDSQFREMVGQPVSEWNLDALRQEYQQLQSQPGMSRQIADRLAAVERKQRIVDDYHEFQSIVKQTDERDEELRHLFQAKWQTITTKQPAVTIIRRDPSNPTVNGVSSSGSVVPPQWPNAVQRTTSPATTPASGQPVVIPQSGIQPQTSPIASQPVAPRGGAMMFDGAGIIQRAVPSNPNQPRYVLLAPNGRVLTYLQPAPGLNLDAYLGQPMGLNGPRSFHPELNSDLLVIQRMTPVRLKN